MKKVLQLVSTVCIFFNSGFAQSPGELDITFGDSGYTLTDPIDFSGEFYWDIITLADDKIVKVGYTQDRGDSDIIIGKFEADGSPDSTFGNNGFLVIDLSMGGDEDARGVYELPNGKLLITGYRESVASLDGFIMRLNPDGSIDPSFGTANGHTPFNTGDNLMAYGRTIRTVGNEIYVGASAIVGGQVDMCVFNFTQAGALDASFSTAGVATMDINGEDDQLFTMDITNNGSFVLGGISDSSDHQLGVVAKFSAFGTPTSFGGNGSYTFDMGSGNNEVYDLFVDANDKVVFTGNHGNAPNIDGFVTRLNADGTIDHTFASNGTMVSNPGASISVFFRSVMQTADNGIVAIGNTDGANQEIYAMMLTSSGGLNADFGGNGEASITPSVSTNTLVTAGGALQTDGSIVIGGYLKGSGINYENMFLLRMLSTADQTSIFEKTSEVISVYPNPVVDRFTVKMENVNRVQMISTVGQVVASWNAQTNYAVPNGITPGVYLLNIEAEDAYGVARILVQ